MSTGLEYADQSGAYKNFIGSLDSEESKRCYRFSLSYFMGFCKLTLYEEIIKIDQPKLEGVIRDYIIHLRQDKKLSPASISAYIAALAHFCEMNDITIRSRKLKKFKGKFRDIIEYRPYTTEQIKKLVDVASLRDKCIILLMASTGIRRSALGFLSIGDLQKIDKYYSEYVMGHKSDLTKSYFKPTDTELLEGNEALGYTAVINDLTIAEEHRLAKQLTEKELFIKQLQTEEQKALAQMRKDMNELRERMERARNNR
ncbi:MAG: hypothetical protein WBQ25_03440 [Nitrososphaeraceae archaeon]